MYVRVNVINTKKNHVHLFFLLLLGLTYLASYLINLDYHILFIFATNEYLILSTIFTVK